MSSIARWLVLAAPIACIAVSWSAHVAARQRTALLSGQCSLGREHDRVDLNPIFSQRRQSRSSHLIRFFDLRTHWVSCAF